MNTWTQTHKHGTILTEYLTDPHGLSMNYTYPCKDRCLFPGVTEWINLPPDSRLATLAKVFTQKLKAKCVLIDDSIVVSGSLIIHAPSAQNELQTS